jgi:hypothetical protein
MMTKRKKNAEVLLALAECRLIDSLIARADRGDRSAELMLFDLVSRFPVAPAAANDRDRKHVGEFMH